MTEATTYAQQFQAWTLGLSFILVLVVIGVVCYWVDNGDLKSPFGPAIRYIERRQKHKQEIEKMKIELEMRRLNPDYTAFLEKEEREVKLGLRSAAVSITLTT